MKTLRAGLPVQLGTSIPLQIDSRVSTLYEVLEFELKASNSEESSSEAIAISHEAIVHEAAKVGHKVTQGLIRARDRARKAAVPVSLQIIDLSGAPYTLCRETLQMEIAHAIVRAISQDSGRCYAILTPALPPQSSAFFELLANLPQHIPDGPYEVSVVANSGEGLRFTRSAEAPNAVSQNNFTLSGQYSNAVKAIHGDLTMRVKRKCIRMLGHYRSSPRGNGRPQCRRFSYYLHDCETEIAELFESWWDKTVGDESVSILYDLRSNSALREVVVAHAEKRGISVERIEDVVTNQELGELVSIRGPAVQVLDAAETGSHLAANRNRLRESGISLTPFVFVGIDKTGERLAADGIRLSGVVHPPSEPDAEHCIQCELGLPHLADGLDSPRRIRSFDFYSMVDESGWAPEKEEEVPKKIGHRFTMLPDFGRIIGAHGRWLAFKLARQLKIHGRDSSWIIFHSDDTDAAHFTQILQEVCSNTIVSVQIPRKDIENAQETNNDWGRVLRRTPMPHWLALIPQERSANVVVMDIFNGSDSTAISLIKLVQQCHLSAAGYGCVVDLNPGRDDRFIAGVPMCSLYELRLPRKMRSGRHV